MKEPVDKGTIIKSLQKEVSKEMTTHSRDKGNNKPGKVELQDKSSHRYIRLEWQEKNCIGSGRAINQSIEAFSPLTPLSSQNHLEKDHKTF